MDNWRIGIRFFSFPFRDTIASVTIGNEKLVLCFKEDEIYGLNTKLFS